MAVGSLSVEVMPVKCYGRLTDTMKNVLEEISNSKKPTPTEVSTKLKMNKASVSRILGDLVNFGIIESERKGQKKFLKLTDSGEKVIKGKTEGKNETLILFL